MFAIRVEELSKRYRVAAQEVAPKTLRDELGFAMRHPLRTVRNLFSQGPDDTFWALKDISLDIQEGDVVGLLGRNGAGKSTLLKILSRITDPTHGRAIVRGRLASLLEVGTGFHPELSGRENIFLNATILGMRRREVVRRLDEIVAFSGVERFLDSPVKHYSSGMYVRLAFAVAAHVEADILLVDEVLAVGDAEFQKRCLGKMGEVAKGGRTVVFVSHNVMAIRNLCTTGALLDRGALVAAGPINDVLSRYGEARGVSAQVATFAPGQASNGRVDLRSVAIGSPVSGGPNRLSIADPLMIRVELDVLSAGEFGVFLHCYGEQQEMVFSSGSFFSERLNGLVLAKGRHAFECEVPANLLNDGNYSLDVLVIRDRHEVVASEMSALSFKVHDDNPGVEGWHWRPAGVIRPVLGWRHARTEDSGQGATPRATALP